MLTLLTVAQLLWASPSIAATGYRWPLDGPPPVVRGYDPPPKPWLPGHRGVDLAAPPGTAVLAAADGTVAFAGAVAGKPVVSIQHADGVRTTYEPVTATPPTGQRVALGEQIGLLQPGHPECAAEACLHWGAKRGEVYLDPLSLLRPRRVRLLPL